jgi:hypothetical protein
MALYSLEKLEIHINKSRRILDDLHCQRRLLLADNNPPKKDLTRVLDIGSLPHKQPLSTVASLVDLAI